jgi:myo-inositol-1(or 4)-monophosphatase
MNDDLKPLLALANEALDLARPHLLNQPAEISAKTERDMVTDIDVAIERDLRSFLRRRAPHVGFVGEEQGSVEADADLVWALDPVDGTANMVHGLPMVAVSLGLIRKGVQVLGAVDLPFLGERYGAMVGHGATNRSGAIAVRQNRDLAEAIVSIGDYAVGPGSAEKNRARVALTAALADRVQRIRMLGSAAIDLVWVAEGKLDACVMLSNKPWDTAAGVAIAREAGAQVVDLDGSPHGSGSKATIAAAPWVSAELLELIQRAAEGVAEAGLD